MPRKGKGLPVWYRGADTYSPLYNEQGRWEYMRYTMIHRFPRDYKQLFLFYLAKIREPLFYPSSHCIPQQALHWLLRMLVDNLQPQHIHYLSAMEVLMHYQEYDMAVDVWRTMERQQIIPDDKLIAMYLQLCTQMKDKDSAFECWNRYCSEKAFLEEGEVDPKPITRVPFTLTREELFHLPKWKKHFDHDPNMDVIDLNRFNTTRNIYRWMTSAMFTAGERDMMETFLGMLEQKLLSTPSPVPEPPNPNMMPARPWDPYVEHEIITSHIWKPTPKTLGLSVSVIDEQHSRFFTNEQYVLKVYCTMLDLLIEGHAEGFGKPYDQALAFMTRCEKLLGDTLKDLDVRSYLVRKMKVERVLGKGSGAAVKKVMAATLDPRGELAHPAHYLEVLEAYATDSAAATDAETPQRLLREISEVIQEMNSAPSFEWTASHHLAILKCLVGCRTMKANEYFVANVLRRYKWGDDFVVALYTEYKMHSDVDMWAELTKRMLVWTCRYDVNLKEETKRLIEEDYDVIGIQMRTTQELAMFKYRHEAEKRERADPTSQLPNPLMNQVSHALPFPDRDTGYPNEYGELGQWRHPNPHLKTKGPGFYAPRMYGEHQKGYHSEWRDRNSTKTPVKLPAPFDRKYKEFARGKHPSYDMVYAGPQPEIFPNRVNFRRKTRWDFQDIHKQSKFVMHGPF